MASFVSLYVCNMCVCVYVCMCVRVKVNVIHVFRYQHAAKLCEAVEL
jgi:hypothetical protein